MLQNLALSSAMIGMAVVIHLAGLLLLLRMLRANAHRTNEGNRFGSLSGQILLMVLVGLGIFAIHGVEIWMFALIYYGVGAFGDFATCLYFSAAAYSTLGFGDVVPSEDWRLLGALEGVAGLILIGWSSAFLLSVTSRLRALEHDWDKYAKR